MRATMALIICTVGCLLLATSATAQDRYAPFPAIGVELPQPDGFEVSNQWQGLQNEATASAVVLMTLPAPLSETTAGFTADRLQAAGMTLHEKTDATIAGKPGVLLNVTQTQEGVEFGKWLAAFGDKATTMIVTTYPKQLEAEMGDVMKSIIIGTRAIEVQRAAMGANVDFALGEGTKLRLASDENNTLLYTKDGTLPQKSPNDPLLVATKSLGRTQIPDIARFALQRIQQTAGTKIGQIESNQPTRIGQLQACETIATGTDASSNAPMLVYQMIILDTDCYFIFQGLVGADGRTEFLPEFQRMAKEFRRNARPERQPIARSDSTPDMPEERRPAGRQLADARCRPMRSLDKPEAREEVRPFEPHGIPDTRRGGGRPLESSEEMRDESGRRRPARDTARQTRRPRPTRLPRPKQPLPEFSYARDDVMLAPELGHQSGERFEDLAPKGGLLVGLRVVRGTDFGGAVQAVEPIFQVVGRYRGAGMHGNAGEDASLLIAPEGHAVGGLQVGSGLWIDALRLVYMRVEGNKLIADNPQYSDWFGGDGGGTTEILSDGSPIVGLAGSFKENLQSLELMYVVPEKVEVEAASAPRKRSTAAADGMRRWTSAKGSSSITARLESFDGTTAKLRTAEGRGINVPAEKLSQADQEFLKQHAGSTALGDGKPQSDAAAATQSNSD